MRALFPYYGAKFRLANWIVSTLPDHKTYVEPFAGSAAVLLRKEPSRYEVLNDLNGDVTTFFRVLRDNSEGLIRRLELTPYSRDEYLLCRDEPAADEVERARRFFARTCMAFNASTAKVGFSGSTPAKPGQSRTFSLRVSETLSVVAERLRAVEIENVDALTLIARWDSPDTLLYLDPPYLDSTRVSTGDYATDNGGEDFHQRLVSALSSFRGKIVLSGYQSELYDSLGWRRMDREVQGSAGSSKNGAVRRVESLWLNFS